MPYGIKLPEGGQQAKTPARAKFCQKDGKRKTLDTENLGDLLMRM